MASIQDLKSGLATRLATISGLRTSVDQPDTITPPIGIVNLSSVNYDTANARGLDTYNFVVTVIVGRVDERTAQRLLDGFVSSTGTSSIKLAIELDRTLGGKCDTLRVSEMRNYGQISIGEVTYLAAEFNVAVYAK